MPSTLERSGHIYAAVWPDGTIKLGFTTKSPQTRVAQQSQFERLTLLGSAPATFGQEMQMHAAIRTADALRGCSRRHKCRETYSPTKSVLAAMAEHAGIRFRVAV